MLFSAKSVRDLLDPSLKTNRKALERHHLFPRAWLERNGIDDRRTINQQANYALLEWPDNQDISDAPPSDYLPRLRDRFADEDWQHMHRLHALPLGWEAMAYEDFLTVRRDLMAGIIRQGFETL